MEDEAEKGLPENKRKKTMGLLTAEGMSYSVMAGVGDAYLPAAAVALGASNFYIGLLSALPQLAGAFLQFFSLSVLRIVKNRKALVIAGCLLQALSWLPIVAVMLWPMDFSVEVIIAMFSLGAGMSLFINPAWASWISDIVPENERGRYFSTRSRLIQITVFATTFMAGIALHQLQLSFPVGVAFAAVFAVAFLARLSSAAMFFFADEVRFEIKLMQEIQMKHLFLLPAYRNELWFLGFVAVMNFSVQFSSPFFTPHILNNLGYGVEVLGLLTAISVITKIVAFPYWGKMVDRFGNRAVLIAAAFMSPLVPFLWMFWGDLPMLIIFQVLSGFIWAGYDLAVFNYALSLVGRELRASFISKYNIFSGFFYAAGALAGGIFLTRFANVALFGYSGILLVFLLSAAMRFLVAVFFTPKIRSGREVPNSSSDRAMVFDLVAVYPTQGAVQHVLHGWNFTRKVMESTTERGGRIIKVGLGATGEIIGEGGKKLLSKVGRRNRL